MSHSANSIPEPIKRKILSLLGASLLLEIPAWFIESLHTKEPTLSALMWGMTLIGGVFYYLAGSMVRSAKGMQNPLWVLVVYGFPYLVLLYLTLYSDRANKTSET
jgi:hypothetical protein